MKVTRLVLFDGVCGFCTRAIQLLLKADRHHVLNFAPLQGSTAAAIFRKHSHLKSGPGSIIFVEIDGELDECVAVQSDAVLRIFYSLGGFWRGVSWLRIIPVPVRNSGYAWIARNRHKWFGRYDECPVPAEESKKYFFP